ncbi:hypothetical protein KBJ98_14415 [Flavobacterium sp. F-328]|jgi:hypothetical protein|uniref:Curli assembly protein CsgC n=1 Tax=Flavobacterium erciyesense TaxID=2825842 RepID=A0ABS5D7D0_9FLAO|nr:hypothetical protein [Flavobacterium erciyesense]MBQ0909903.1 hypothetical protein [Flavobacterium erciyesense]
MFRLNFFLFFFIFLNGINAQVIQDEIKAKIEIKDVEGNTIITGTAENISDILKSASYKLTVIKKNNINNNQTNNAQEGMFTLNRGEFKKLSSTEINIDNGDEVIVMLLFYDEKKQIISKDRVVLGEQKKKMK